MKTYEIKYQPIVIDGVKIDKYNVYYYIDGEIEVIEFHSKDGTTGEVIQGYEKK